MITNKELSMSIDEQTLWMETQLKVLSESLKIIELLIKDEDDDAYDHIPGYVDSIKSAREHFMTISEQLYSMGWISLFDISTKWYEDVVAIAVCYNHEQSIYRKTVYEECKHAVEIWNDLVYMLMN